MRKGASLKSAINYDFLSLDGFELQWELTEDGREIAFGTISQPGIEPAPSAYFPLWTTTPPKTGGFRISPERQPGFTEARGLLPAELMSMPMPSLNSAVPSAQDETRAASTRRGAIEPARTMIRSCSVSGDGFSIAFSRESGLAVFTGDAQGQELMLTR